MHQLSRYSNDKGILKSVTIIGALFQMLGRSLQESCCTDWMNTLNSQGFYQKAKLMWIQESKRKNWHDLHSKTASRTKKREAESGPVDLTKALDTANWPIVRNFRKLWQRFAVRPSLKQCYGRSTIVCMHGSKKISSFLIHSLWQYRDQTWFFMH